MKIHLFICGVGISLWSCFGAELLPAGAGENPVRESLSPSVEIDRVQALKIEISKQTEILESLQSRYYDLLNWLMSWFSWRGVETATSQEKTEIEKEELQRQIATTRETVAKLEEELELAQSSLDEVEPQVYSLDDYKNKALLNRSAISEDCRELYERFIENACVFLANRFSSEKERVLAGEAVLDNDNGLNFFNRFVGSNYIKNVSDKSKKIELLMDFFMAKVQRLYGIMRPRAWESKV